MFDGLQIAKNKKLCEEYQEKYPVIFLSFKNVEGLTFADAQYRLAELIAGEAERFAFLAQSDKLTENERSLYCGLTAVREGRYALAGEVLVSALQLLSKLLSKHYGQKTVWVRCLLFCFGKFLGNISLVHELLVLGIVLNIDEDRLSSTMVCNNYMVMISEHLRDFSIMVAQIAGRTNKCLHHKGHLLSKPLYHIMTTKTS